VVVESDVTGGLTVTVLASADCASVAFSALPD
jgi:hypothetical protein